MASSKIDGLEEEKDVASSVQQLLDESKVEASVWFDLVQNVHKARNARGGYVHVRARGKASHTCVCACIKAGNRT